MGNSNSEHIPVVSKAEVYRFFSSRFHFWKTVLPKLKKHGVDCSVFETKANILPREFVLKLFHVEQIQVSEWNEFINKR
jgi:hypothetical protein